MVQTTNTHANAHTEYAVKSWGLKRDEGKKYRAKHGGGEQRDESQQVERMATAPDNVRAPTMKSMAQKGACKREAQPCSPNMDTYL